MFYSADACCGRSCDYKLGVARAKQLLGPWERNPANPILGGNSRWQCPGHGSVVETPDGRDFLLYHAYRTIGFQFIGRQGVLDAITWTADGWPTINNGEGPSEKAPAPLAAMPSKSDRADVVDDFLGPRLRTGWQWPWDQPPDASIVAQSLVLRTSGRDATSAVDAIVARQARVPDYTAGARIAKPAAGVMAGLCAYGDGANALGASLTSDSLVVWIREKNVQRIVATVPLAVKTFVDVRMVVTGAERYSFQFSVDGADWQKAGDDADGAFLPPWDGAVRVALVVGGPKGAEGRFDSFRLTPR